MDFGPWSFAYGPTSIVRRLASFVHSSQAQDLSSILRRLRTYSLSSVVFLLVIAMVAWAVAAAPGHAQGTNTWTKLGSLPATTGEGPWQLASDGVDLNTLYVLGDQGMARSTDGGTSWQPCNLDARTMAAVSPLQGQNTTTALFSVTPAGLRRSDDSCRTWNDVPTQDIAPSGAHIRWLAPYPDNLTVLYAGMDGLGGLYRSVDGGNTWQGASQGLPAGAWVTSLTADPAHPATIFIGVRFPSDSHSMSYLFRSSDGGLTWRSSSEGLYVLPNNDGYVNGLAWSGERLFASTLNDGLYSSTDRGITWHSAITPGSKMTGSTVDSSPRINALAAGQDGVLLLETSLGAFQSLDSGHSWQNFGPDGTIGREMLMAFDPVTGRVLLGSTDAIWSYTLPKGVALVPTSAPSSTVEPSPTPPPPPMLPTSTPAPPTDTPTLTPAPPTPTPTLVQGYKPSDPAAPGDPSIFTFFPDTNHNLGHGFRDFWQANGGLVQFGYPITEEFVENGVTVQYFQRARFEYRDGNVTLGRLGAELTEGQFFRPVPFFPSTDTNAYFGATGHSVEGPFLTFWQQNGREALLGYPISESFTADGSDYQWFERVRLEWHSYLPEGQQIVLGNIGVEALQKRGWLP